MPTLLVVAGYVMIGGAFTYFAYTLVGPILALIIAGMWLISLGTVMENKNG